MSKEHQPFFLGKVQQQPRNEETVPEIGLSEYRTVLAEQRTLLAFVRTALAVAAVYGASETGVVLGILIVATGAAQYALVQPLFLLPSTRNENEKKSVNSLKLLQYAQYTTASIFALMLAVGVAAVLHKHSNP
jgi:uncharacterized membrane protein YidH (DUF202 family)